MQDAREFVELMIAILKKYGSFKKLTEAEYTELVKEVGIALDDLIHPNHSRT